MSGHKQPAAVKQTREVGSTVYLTVEALLSAIDNLVHWVVSGKSRFNTVGDPHQQEANKTEDLEEEICGCTTHLYNHK